MPDRTRRAVRPTPPRRYVPIEELQGGPHVVVDGAPRPGTRLTLSHWPGTPTPEFLRGDLSAELVLDALDRPGVLDVGSPAVSLDHYDEDGVISLGLLVLDELADDHRQLMVDAARVGDFGVVAHRRAALVAFALGALAPSNGASLEAGAGRTRSLSSSVSEALSILPGLAEDLSAFEKLWSCEAASYEASLRALDEGRVSIEEIADLDLAVIRLEDDEAQTRSRQLAWAGRAMHPAAVHTATPMLRVATVAAGRLELRYRYESWVRMSPSKRAEVRPRVDLSALAVELTEIDDVRWEFDGAGAITPSLHPQQGLESSFDGEWFVSKLCERLIELDRGPAAWDPYRRRS